MFTKILILNMKGSQVFPSFGGRNGIQFASWSHWWILNFTRL